MILFLGFGGAAATIASCAFAFTNHQIYYIRFSIVIQISVVRGSDSAYLF